MIYLENLFNQLLRISVVKHITALAVILIATLINKWVICKIFISLEKLVQNTENFIDDTIIKAMEKPVKLFILFKGIYYALIIIEYDK